MLETDQFALDSEVSGSLQETLVLRGSIGERGLLVLFSAEILDHWPGEIQRARLNEMLPFIECAIKRAIAARRFSVVGKAFTGDDDAYLVVLGWMDIAS